MLLLMVHLVRPMQRKARLLGIVLVLCLVMPVAYTIIMPHFAKASAPQAVQPHDLQFPYWWNGTCDANNDNDSYSAATWNGLNACYPDSGNVQDDDPTRVPNNPNGTGFQGTNAKWECVELSERYLYLQYGFYSVYAPTGDVVAQNYYDTYHSQYPNLQFFSEGPGLYPAIGDVVSITWSSGGPHTAIVTNVSISSPGNATLTIFQENAFNGGPVPYGTLTMSNWSVEGTSMFQWLHYNTISNPQVNVHESYVIGSNHHLYNYHYVPNSQGQYSWGYTDVSSAVGVTNLIGQPSAHWLKQNGGLVHDVFATGSDGHVHEFYFENSKWTTDDLWTYAYPGHSHPADGATFTGSPFGFSYYDSNGNPHHSVYVTASDGKLYHYNWPVNINGTLYWELDPPINPPSGYAFTTAPAAYAYDSTGDQLLYAIATDGKVYEYNNPFGTTTWTLLNTFSLPSNRTAVGSPSAYSYSNSGGTYHMLYVTGSNGQVYNFYYASSGGGWQGPNSMLPGGIVPTGSPNGHPSFVSGATTQIAITTTNTGNMQEMYSSSDTPSSWSSVTILSSGSLGFQITGSPYGYSYLSSDQVTNTTIVFFTGSDGLLHDAYSTNIGQTGWSHSNLPAVSGVSFSGATPSGYGVPSNI